MNNRKALLKILIEDYLYLPEGRDHVNIIISELKKYKDHIPKNKYKIIDNYISLLNGPYYRNKDDDICNLQDKVIKVIDKHHISDDYYSGTEESDEEIITDDNSYTEIEELKDKIKLLSDRIGDLKHKIRLLEHGAEFMKSNIKQKDELIESLRDTINILKGDR